MNRSRFSSLVWKFSSGLVIAATVFGGPLSDIVPFLPATPIAYAQAITPPTAPNIVPCVPLTAPGVSGVPGGAGLCTDMGQYQATIGNIKNSIRYQLTVAAMTSFMNAMTYFTQTVAYDTATWVSNGFKGEKPGIFTDPFGTYTQNLVLDSVGEFMGSFSESFTKGTLGVDLCRPPNFPQLALSFSLKLPGLYLNTVQRPRPKCSWTSIVSNWKQAAASLDNPDALNNIKANFSTGGNDLSFGIGAHLAFFDAVAQERESGIAERLMGGGYKDVTNFLSGNIETPSQTVKRSVEHTLIENPAQVQNGLTMSTLGNAFSLGWIQLGVVTASTFTNVLLSRLLQRIAKGLVKTDGGGLHALPDLTNPNAAGPSPEEIASSQFSDLLTPHISKNDAQDLLSDLTACPSDARTKWNCAIDQSFGTALRQGGGLTVRQAIDQGFIKPLWQLLPSTMLKDNQDPTCSSRAFCVANLRKLRAARILPIGWELAAEAPANQQACLKANSCITLGEVINHFDDCNVAGQLDDAHPYCHLIDPNWVLTLFPAQCQTEGYGNQTLGGTSQRLQECQDTATCLERDKDGNCTGGYGYCMAEQTFWQFDAPSCKDQFATCRTFVPRGNGAQPISYLRSTLDYGTCNADNVGCMWYATLRDPKSTDPDSGWNASSTAANSSAFAGAGDRIYFDKNVVPCDAKNDGCSALRRIERGVSALNLIQNGSFEATTGTTPTLNAWTAFKPAWTYTAPSVGTGSASQDGTQALLASSAGSGSMTQQEILGIQPLRGYVLSFYARQNTSQPAGAAITLNLLQKDGKTVANPGTTSYFRGTDCTISNLSFSAVGANITPAADGTWTRFTCTFVTTPDTGKAVITIKPGTSADGVLVDGVQLEEGEVPTPYVEGLNTSLAVVNMKVPPDELACTGNVATDNKLCGNFARVCSQNEAGCQGYRATGDAASAEIPAVLTNADICPAECVGYAEYRKQPSTFDLVRDANPLLDDPADDTVASFIPSTGLSCSSQDVGCELFTNLDGGATGETQSAFSYLRACEKPDTNSQTYYTWEGSDTSGYQLKTWSLKRDSTAPAPQGPRAIEKTGSDGVLKDPAACNETTYLQALDPDCRQFYDPQGHVFYRFESQTILSSNDCHDYRKDGSDQADCEKTGGTFNTQTNQCVYGADPSQSRVCSAQVAGCRGYAGTQGRAQEEIFNEDFSSKTFSATSKLGAGATGATLAQSTEAVLVGDNSLRAQRNGASRTFYVGPMNLNPGGLYELTFWAKGVVSGAIVPTVTVTAANDVSAVTSPVGSSSLSADWRTYRMGPFQVTKDDGKDYLTFTMDSGDQWFFDKIRVQRIQDISYVVKESWNTPASCDRTPEGIPQPQAMLGCRAYTDRNNKTVDVRQFTRLCREDVIGCTAYVDTRNTESPYAQSWSKTGIPATTIEKTDVLGDRYGYFVEDKSKFCSASAVSCRAFGKPNYRQDRLALDSKKPFSTVYLMNNPANYDSALCSEKELFCEAYTYSTDHESGTAYFRAPGTHACEYRTSVAIPNGTVPNLVTTGQTYDGWFEVGTPIPCYPDQLKSGSVFDIRLTGDPGYDGWNGADRADYPAGEQYRGWTGTCPKEQAECTEFRDVTDKSNVLRPLGRPYFVVNNSALDETSCNSQVDPGHGCVLFRDLSDTRLLFNSAATYDLYKKRAYQSVEPVSCAPGNINPSCTAVGATGNDTNVIVKVKPDRSCSQWMSCSTSETVYDPQTGQYKSICSSLALCNKAGQSEGAGIPFCSNYVNRTSAAQTALTNFTVMDAAQYAARPTGFGAVDYSGATIPDHFQVMDSKLEPVGYTLAVDPAVQSKFKKDYRLVVAVPIQTNGPGGPKGNQGEYFTQTKYGATLASLTQKKGLAAMPELAPYACVYKTPGGPINVVSDDLAVSYGLTTDAAGKLSTVGQLCWLSLDQEQPPQLGVGGAPLVSDNLNMLNLVTRLRQSIEPKLDQTLNSSLPDAECKAAPEGDSPFGNEFVLEWDDTVTPPTPKRVADGYSQMNFCEYGENCACSYKRVEYGGPSRFYEPLSTSVSNAVCIGGPRDGEPCALNAGIKGSQPIGVVPTIDPATGKPAVDDKGNPITTTLNGGGSAGSNPNSSCGDSGVCSPIKAVKLVRGAIGQCLEDDLSRSVAGDSSRHECLVWSPNPLFEGPGDPYHWIPTAGFQPPQSSGRYYCTAPIRPPKTLSLRANVDVKTGSLGTSVGMATNKNKTYAGSMTKLWYDDAVTSDGSCVGIPNPFGDSCDGNESGGSLDGTTSDGTDMGKWCEEADDDQSPSQDFEALRIITTGRGANRSYAEYALLLDWKQIGKTVAGYPATTPDTGLDAETLKENSLEDTISSFAFSTDSNKLACEYGENWVPGSGDNDYDDRSSWEPKDATWRAGFKAELARSGAKLDRHNAQVLTEDGTNTGIPVKITCNNPDNDAGDQGGCFIKTWTLNYRADGQLKAQAFGPDIGRASMDSLSRNPVYGTCDSDHSWFSIKAVFEDTNTNENGKDAQDVNPEALQGPFQIVGFWVTACAPGSGPNYIYTYVNMSTADVCRELAETISKDSHDAVAFTDRNSEKSGFAIPRNGFQWSTTNIPFGASLATGDAGIEPLYMTGVKQAGANPLHPPIFTYPGQTYFSPQTYPKSNWGLLSNIFAKIYRIYGYNSRGVTRNDWACTNPASPNFGQWCPNLDNISQDATPADQKALSAKYCGYAAKCVKTAIAGADLFSQKVCNTFSGVNRGLDCSSDPDICHRGPVQLGTDGVLRTQYAACKVNSGSGWVEMTNKRWKCDSSRGTCPSGNGLGGAVCSGCTGDNGCQRSVAVKCGAFRCADGSARSVAEVGDNSASYCTLPSTPEKPDSQECPLAIAPNSEKCVKAGSDPTGFCEQHAWAACAQNADCHFVAQNYWPSGPANSFFDWSAKKQFSTKLGNTDDPAALPKYGYEISTDLSIVNIDEACGKKSWDDPECVFKNAFSPALPSQAPEGTRFFALRVTAADSALVNGANNALGAGNGLKLMALFPGFAPTIGDNANALIDSSPVQGATTPLFTSSTVSPPYVVFVPQGPSTAKCVAKRVGNSVSSSCSAGPKVGLPCVKDVDCRPAPKNPDTMIVQWGACEPLALMYQSASSGATRSLGTCQGGARSGSVCGGDNDCLPSQVTISGSAVTIRDSKGKIDAAAIKKMNDAAAAWCNPVAGRNANGAYTVNRPQLSAAPVPPPPAPGKGGNLACWGLPSNPTGAQISAVQGASNFVARQEDVTLDNNICTHPPGYWPRPTWCKDANDEYCGLLGYDLPDLDNSVNDDQPLPTDVTPGLYTPKYLNPNGSSVSANANDYNYIHFYNPIPPQVTAPDMRSCQGGTCKTGALGTIGIDGLSEGIVNGGAGSHVAALRFYAWASHEQMPLRRVVIDWGDGSKTELPDAFLKNHKPYCQTEKECSQAPGLTCQSDNDCPPGGGTCQSYGSCAADPTKRCSRNAECDTSKGDDGVCNPRVVFGNDSQACEEQYFEFRHSYSCLPSSQPAASCAASKSCSNNPLKTCTDDTNCAAGDRCVSSQAKANGCFDKSANTCRFTPRLMLVDNWGWCSGECRTRVNQSGLVVDDPTNKNLVVRHPNGGCYDAVAIKANTGDFSSPITNLNECDQANPAGPDNTERPWVVFPGSIQVRSGEAK